MTDEREQYNAIIPAYLVFPLMICYFSSGFCAFFSFLPYSFVVFHSLAAHSPWYRFLPFTQLSPFSVHLSSICPRVYCSDTTCCHHIVFHVVMNDPTCSNCCTNIKNYFQLHASFDILVSVVSTYSFDSQSSRFKQTFHNGNQRENMPSVASSCILLSFQHFCRLPFQVKAPSKYKQNTSP